MSVICENISYPEDWVLQTNELWSSRQPYGRSRAGLNLNSDSHGSVLPKTSVIESVLNLKSHCCAAVIGELTRMGRRAATNCIARSLSFLQAFLNGLD